MNQDINDENADKVRLCMVHENWRQTYCMLEKAKDAVERAKLLAKLGSLNKELFQVLEPCLYSFARWARRNYWMGSQWTFHSIQEDLDRRAFEAFADLLLDMPKTALDSKGNPFGYMWRVMKNQLRKKESKGPLDMPIEDVDGRRLPQSDTAEKIVIEGLDNLGFRNVVEQWKFSLTWQDSVIYELRIEEYPPVPHKEIAEIIEWDTQRVRKRWSRMLKELRELFGGDNDPLGLFDTG